MAENVIMELLPTEMLMNIFSFLTLKELVKCRQVSSRIKLIADSLLSNQELWKKQCKKDFCDLYQTAYYRRIPGLDWCNIYRSLTLWPKLDQATEKRDEFVSSISSADEIQHFQVLRNGIVGVLTQTSIIYFNVVTLQHLNERDISGAYLSFSENDNAIVILGYYAYLYVVRRVKGNERTESRITFENVKTFVLAENNVYYVSVSNEVFRCNLDADVLSSELLNQTTNSITSIGYSNGCLHLLTFDKEIYTMIGKEMVWNYSLDSSSDLLYELKKFNFLENFDWKLYFQWMFIIRHTVLRGPLSDISDIRTITIYGEAVLVGSDLGVLSIYYAPYCNGEYDLFKTKPIKQYNFMEIFNCPAASRCPIIKIDVIEGEDSHLIVIAMPKKIVILTYSHSLKGNFGPPTAI